MNIWEELAEFKKRIPKDAEIYRVHVRYDNILCEHRVYLESDNWSNYNLGLIDAPLDHSLCGYYSTKEKAVQAVKEATRRFTYPVKW